MKNIWVRLIAEIAGEKAAIIRAGSHRGHWAPNL